MRQCNEVFLNDPYPYASEYPADTTAHEQVYFFTRYFGNTEKNRKTLQIAKALRGGNQPVWFQYGNDNKGDLTCWYTESTNGWALLRGFEDTGDLDTLIKGFAGVMSVEVDLLPDGMCFAHFISTPGVFDFVPPRTLDGGIAQFGFLKAAKSYVIQDDSFGLIGCGCRVESSGKEVRVYPCFEGLRHDSFRGVKGVYGFEVIRTSALGTLLGVRGISTMTAALMPCWMKSCFNRVRAFSICPMLNWLTSVQSRIRGSDLRGSVHRQRKCDVVRQGRRAGCARTGHGQGVRPCRRARGRKAAAPPTASTSLRRPSISGCPPHRYRKSH